MYANLPSLQPYPEHFGLIEKNKYVKTYQFILSTCFRVVSISDTN